MAFTPFPWKNKGEPGTTKLNRQNLNSAEEAFATQIGNGEVALPSSVVSSSGGTAQDLFVVTGNGTYTKLPVGNLGEQLTVRSDGTLHWSKPTSISAKAWGVVADGVTDDSAALNKADEAAVAGGYVVSLPEGTIAYKKTLRFTRWEGIPGRTTLKMLPEFAYEGFGKQFSAINRNFAAIYNAETADTVIMRGVNWIIEGASEEGKGSIGFGNIAGGEFKRCFGTTTGGKATGAVFDVYTCSKRLDIEDVSGVNATKAATGGGMWIRNGATHGEEAESVTEGVTINKCYFATTTGDEAFAVFGFTGAVKNIRVKDTVFQGLPSAQTHQRLVSVFPKFAEEAVPNASVENVNFDGCTFLDLEGTCVGEVYAVGSSHSVANKCQNISNIKPSFYVKTTQVGNSQSICRNTPNAFDAPFAGITIDKPYINATGSSQGWLSGITGFTTVTAPTILGNVNIPLNTCGSVTGGEIEAVSRGAYNCGPVVGVRMKLNAGAAACYLDNSTLTFAGIKDCTIEGGKQLVVATSGVNATVHVDMNGNTMKTTATSGNVIETPTSSPPRVILRDNTVYGEHELTRTGTIALSKNNDWYGTTD